MSESENAFQKVVSWADTCWTVIGWFGWKQLVGSAALSFAASAWAVLQGVPTSIIAIAAFCVFVAAVYLTKIPAFVRATQQLRPSILPNMELWRHRKEFKLYEAACLLANQIPRMDIPYSDAQAWFSLLSEAIVSGELSKIKTAFDDQHTFVGVGYVPYNETVMAKDELKKFVESRHYKAPFLQ